MWSTFFVFIAFFSYAKDNSHSDADQPRNVGWPIDEGVEDNEIEKLPGFDGHSVKTDDERERKRNDSDDQKGD
jgi:hypothetical protein